MILIGLSSSSVIPVGTPVANASSPLHHSPILIEGDNEFTADNGVTGGTGLPKDPYVIGGWEINNTSGSGITLHDTDAYVSIRDVYVHSSRPGILLDHTSNVRVENSILSYNGGTGIVSVLSNNVIIASSQVIRNYGDGIVFDNSTRITVTGTAVSINYGGGILFCDSQEITIVGSRISSNNVGVDSLRTPCKGQNISSGFFIAGNEIVGNDDRGIGLLYTFNDTIVNNNVSFNGERDVYIFGGRNVSVINNQLNKSSEGLDIFQGQGFVISGNTLFHNQFDGLRGLLSGSSIVDNVVVANGNGINLSAMDTSVVGNNVVNNTGDGVLLAGSYNVRVFHNSLIGNRVQAFDDLNRSSWDDGYPSGGNFWSDYSGIDNCSGSNQDICPNSDGIGDTPYGFQNNKDRYPLVKPFESTVQGEVTYFPNPIRSKITSKLLAAIISLPLSSNVSSIVPSSIRLNGTITPVSGTPTIVQAFPGVSQVIVWFNLTGVRALLSTCNQCILQVSGNIVTNKAFKTFVAAEAVRVLRSQHKSPIISPDSPF